MALKSDQKDNGSAQQALRSLLQSVVPETADSSKKLTPDVVQKLTEKLSELVGYDAVRDFNHHRNERGELLNEEGLPVVDISEPILEAEPTGGESVLLGQDPLISLNDLPSVARERLRHNRDRILDALEEEERQEEERERQKEREGHEEIRHKRLEAAANEKERLRAAKELQKKMGKALLRNLATSKEKEEEEEERLKLQEEEEIAKRKALATKKKTVAFADQPQDVSEEKSDSTWGDVTPARLRPSNRPTLLSERQIEKQPMKMIVVERVPGGKPTLSKTESKEKDSDDESDQSTLGDESEDDFASGDDASEDGHSHVKKDAAQLEKEVDWDFAVHQRQIELEYHRKRIAIAEVAGAAMQNHSHQDDSHDHLLDVGAPSPDTPRPTIPQFRADKLASAYGASNPGLSTSLGDFVVPATTACTLQREVRSGKVDAEGNLVGGEDDSASEAEDEGMQEVLELLRKGEIYNIGPNYVHPVPPSSFPYLSAEASSASRDLAQLPRIHPPLSKKPTTSKFKASRLAAGRPAGQEPLSPSQTPINQLGRSSPKLASPISTPTDSQFPSFSQQAIHSPVPLNVSQKSTSFEASQTFPTIVDSPLFPTGNLPSKEHTPTIVSSPSFPPRAPGRPDHPPTIIASTVRETRSPQGVQTVQAEIPQESEKKILRFKKERM